MSVQVNFHFCTCRAQHSHQCPWGWSPCPSSPSGCLGSKDHSSWILSPQSSSCESPDSDISFPRWRQANGLHKQVKCSAVLGSLSVCGFADCPVIILISVSCNRATIFNTSSCLHYKRNPSSQWWSPGQLVHLVEKITKYAGPISWCRAHLNHLTFGCCQRE